MPITAAHGAGWINNSELIRRWGPPGRDERHRDSISGVRELSAGVGGGKKRNSDV